MFLSTLQFHANGKRTKPFECSLGSYVDNVLKALRSDLYEDFKHLTFPSVGYICLQR